MKKNYYLISFTLLVFYSVLFITPFAIPSIPDPDGLQQLSFDAILHDAFWSFREFPLWNPYFGGGIPWAGYFQNSGISISSIFPILFGEILGLKIKIVLYSLLGALSLYYILDKYIKGPAFISIFVSLVYGISTRNTGVLLDGNYTSMEYFLLPFYLYLAEGILFSKKRIIIFPFLIQNTLALAHYRVFYLLLFTYIFSFYFFSIKKRLKFTKIFLVIIFFGILLSFSKILPLFQEFSYNLVDFSRTNAAIFLHPEDFILNIAFLKSNIPRWHMGIGLLASIACILGIYKSLLKKKYFLIFLSVILFLIVCGPNSYIPLFKIIKFIPILSIMRDYVKYYNHFLFFIMLVFTTLGLQYIFVKIKRDRNRKVFEIIFYLFLSCNLAQLWMASHELLEKSFSRSFPNISKSNEFYHISYLKYNKSYEKYRFVHNNEENLNQYFNFKKNIGTISWYGNFIYKENAIPKRIFYSNDKFILNDKFINIVTCLNKDYTFNSSCQIKKLEFSYNKIFISLKKPYDGKLLVNFNYNKFWKGMNASVNQHNGLLLIEGKEGQKNIQLYYKNSYFNAGFYVMILGLLLWFFYCRSCLQKSLI